MFHVNIILEEFERNLVDQKLERSKTRVKEKLGKYSPAKYSRDACTAW